MDGSSELQKIYKQQESAPRSQVRRRRFSRIEHQGLQYQLRLTHELLQRLFGNVGSAERYQRSVGSVFFVLRRKPPQQVEDARHQLSLQLRYPPEVQRQGRILRQYEIRSCPVDSLSFGKWKLRAIAKDHL